MKKALVCLVILAVIAGMSCQSGPTKSGAVIDGSVTQEKIDSAFNKIYDAYRSKLDLTGAREYTVQRGDTLSDITRRHYGNMPNVGQAGPSNGFYFPLLMLASNHVIVDPDFIEPGMKIVIPDLRKNLDNSASRKAIKNCISDVSYIYDKKGQTANYQGLVNLANSL